MNIYYYSYLSLTDNAANPFSEVVVVVNGKVQPDATNLVEGDSLFIIFRQVGLSGFYQSPICRNLRVQTHFRAGCKYGGRVCSNIRGHAHVIYYIPVELSDNGTVVTVIQGNVTYSVTINGKMA